MSEDTITKSVELLTTYDTETGLVRYVVDLSQLDDVIATMNKQAKRLQAENERLRKAGDALSYALQTCKYSAEEIEHYSDSWTKAKEGAP